jgi:hypothetical protein
MEAERMPNTARRSNRLFAFGLNFSGVSRRNTACGHRTSPQRVPALLSLALSDKARMRQDVEDVARLRCHIPAPAAIARSGGRFALGGLIQLGGRLPDDQVGAGQEHAAEEGQRQGREAGGRCGW